MPGQGRLGDKAQIPADAHGCPGCPHPAIGPAISGSGNVNVNGKPALRLGDSGMHAACCGPNTWNAKMGSATVFINGKPAHRMNDPVQHCGGMGKLVEGSGDVIVGGAPSSGSGSGAAAADNDPGAISQSAAGGGSAKTAVTPVEAQQDQAGAGGSSGGSAPAGSSSSSSGSSPESGVGGGKMGDKLVLAANLKGIGDVPMVGELFDVIDPDTGSAIGQVQPDKDGNVRAYVLEDKNYELRLASPIVEPEPGEDAQEHERDHQFHLFVELLDEHALPMGNVEVRVSGDGVTEFTTWTDEYGHVDVPVPPGVYDLKVKDKTFRTNSILVRDLVEHNFGQAHRFSLAPEPKKMQEPSDQDLWDAPPDEAGEEHDE
jgi:uncharacterized Zn-binding protein involved in type VI secretion